MEAKEIELKFAWLFKRRNYDLENLHWYLASQFPQWCFRFNFWSFSKYIVLTMFVGSEEFESFHLCTVEFTHHWSFVNKPCKWTFGVKIIFGYKWTWFKYECRMEKAFESSNLTQKCPRTNVFTFCILPHSKSSLTLKKEVKSKPL